MEPEDPFGWITKLCQGSVSEDSSLRSCSYFGQSDSDISGLVSGRKNPPDIPVASTGITMVSLDNDGDTVSLHPDSSDSGGVVDLGKDTDLVFSEVEVQADSTQEFEADSTPNGASRGDPEEMLVSEPGFSSDGQLLTEHSSKKLKSLGFESPSVRLGSLRQRSTDEQTISELELEDPQYHEEAEVGEGSVGEKRFDFSTEVMECDTEEINIESQNDNAVGNSGGRKKCVEDSGGNGSNMGGNEMQEKTEGKRVLPPWADRGEGYEVETNVGESVQMQEKTEGKRVLPSWADRGEGYEQTLEVNVGESVQMQEKTKRKRVLPPWADTDWDSMSEDFEETADAESDSASEDFEKPTLFDVLLDLEEDCEADLEEERNLASLSLLEVAQREWGKDFLDK